MRYGIIECNLFPQYALQLLSTSIFNFFPKKYSLNFAPQK